MIGINVMLVPKLNERTDGRTDDRLVLQLLQADMFTCTQTTTDRHSNRQADLQTEKQLNIQMDSLTDYI